MAPRYHDFAAKRHYESPGPAPIEGVTRRLDKATGRGYSAPALPTEIRLP
jgi:hypothetical protein